MLAAIALEKCSTFNISIFPLHGGLKKQNPGWPYRRSQNITCNLQITTGMPAIIFTAISWTVRHITTVTEQFCVGGLSPDGPQKRSLSSLSFLFVSNLLLSVSAFLSTHHFVLHICGCFLVLALSPAVRWLGDKRLNLKEVGVQRRTKKGDKMKGICIGRIHSCTHIILQGDLLRLVAWQFCSLYSNTFNSPHCISNHVAHKGISTLRYDRKAQQA